MIIATLWQLYHKKGEKGRKIVLWEQVGFMQQGKIERKFLSVLRVVGKKKDIVL